jgi:hypothetical protein
MPVFADYAITLTPLRRHFRLPRLMMPLSPLLSPMSRFSRATPYASFSLLIFQRHFAAADVFFFFFAIGHYLLFAISTFAADFTLVFRCRH